MKKIIISILIIVLGVIAYLMIGNNFQIGSLSINNISEIKALDEQLQQGISVANEKIKLDYEDQLNKLKTSIEQLTSVKEKYEQYNIEEKLETVEIKKYKIEYLWAIIGQYAKQRNTKLTLNIAEVPDSELYNLNFTLVGEYVDIVNCLSDIEDDDSFNFKIENFVMKPYTKLITTEEIDYYDSELDDKEISRTAYDSALESESTTTKNKPYDSVEVITETEDKTKATLYNPKQLIASFTVNDVGIDFN